MQRGCPRRGAKEWRALVEAWRRSGQSSKEFCAERGIAPKQLGWWAWELKRRERVVRESCEAGPATFLPLKVVGRGESSVTASAPSVKMVEIALGEGQTIRVPVGTDAVWLGQMVAALQGGGQ